MPTERLSMRHIREVLRLHYSVGMSQRAVASSLGLAQGTVSKYLNRTRRAGVTWPLPPELEIVDDRYDKGSLLITSQVPVSLWHDVIADPTLGDAILDRFIHNAHRIELKGDSLRRRAGEKNTA